MLRYSVALLLLCTAAHAATPQLEGANIAGNGGTLTITRMPIQTANGIIYRDVTIQLQADENGNVSFARGRAAAPVVSRAPGLPAATPIEPGLAEVQPLTQAPSKPVKVQNFRVGTYRGADGSLMQLTGGGKAFLVGVPAWTFALVAGGGTLSTATWYEGLISDNPRERLIRRAGISSLEYSYGTSDAGDGKLFGSGALIGATMDGDTLTIVGFHRGCCNVSTPTASLTYTYIGR